jgi:uncharacterized protein (DUF2147 family)
MTKKKWALGAVGMMMLAALAQAQESPVGRWKTVDDATKEVKSIVQISEDKGVLSGKIEKILTANKDALCTECTDERKGKPVQGLTIIRNVKKFGEGDKVEWGEGDILDPQNGKIYKVRLRLQDGGKKLEVRGFIGFAAMGRSQYWVREQ